MRFVQSFAAITTCHKMLCLFFQNPLLSDIDGEAMNTLSLVPAHQAPSSPNPLTAFLRPDDAGVVCDIWEEAVIWSSAMLKSSIPRGLWHLPYSKKILSLLADFHVIEETLLINQTKGLLSTPILAELF